MTRESAFDLVNVLVPFLDKKPVQFFNVRSGKWDDCGGEIPDFALANPKHMLRIKPEPMEITLMANSDGTLWVDNQFLCALATSAPGTKTLKFRQVME